MATTDYKAGVTSVTTARRFSFLTPSDSTVYTPDQNLKALYIVTGGNIALTDHDDAATGTFAVVAGQHLYVSPKKVNAATSCTLLGLFA